jgi:hypothetical protein
MPKGDPAGYLPSVREARDGSSGSSSKPGKSSSRGKPFGRKKGAKPFGKSAPAQKELRGGRAFGRK